jgi:iron complex transport system substrate-binding protein
LKRSLRLPLLIALAAVALLQATGCGRFANREQKVTRQERIVCLSKQYNEIIYALGAERDLVAVDLSSTYPPAIAKLPTVGYHRALAAESILAMKPTIVIHDNNIGPEHVVRQLQQLHIPMKVFNAKANDVESTKQLMREMGAYFHKEQRAEELCAQLDAGMKKAQANAALHPDKPKVLVIHFGRASNAYMVMNGTSVAGRMIEWAGGTMPVAGERNMTPMSPELIAQADPDVILLTDFGYDRLGTAARISELPGVGSTRAARTGRIYRVQESDLVYIGPRTGANVLELQRLIHGNQPRT